MGGGENLWQTITQKTGGYFWHGHMNENELYDFLRTGDINVQMGNGQINFDNYAVEIFSANIIMNFAIRNSKEGKDFRRALFAKEREIFSLFGKDFEERKNKEIDEILKNNPYNDI